MGNAVDEAKSRMLSWGNPVEFVNNMYGCHPDGDGDRDYFDYVFGDSNETSERGYDNDEKI